MSGRPLIPPPPTTKHSPPAPRTRRLRQELADAVRLAIMRGEYAPGSPLGEIELAERFGVSRGPVREALIQLEREYLVRSHPNRGSFVTSISEAEFDEILMLRSVLEPIALERAKARVTRADLKALRQRLRKLESAAKLRDHRSYIIQDYEFHVAIWELSGHALLPEILKRISAPVFIFESIVEDRYRDANYDVVADARAHGIIVDYLAGKTEQSAHQCIQPVLELAIQAEKPVVFSSGQWRRR
jgi:DNA-binding GntR family transcriptional regulator